MENLLRQRVPRGGTQQAVTKHVGAGREQSQRYRFGREQRAQLQQLDRSGTPRAQPGDRQRPQVRHRQPRPVEDLALVDHIFGPLGQQPTIRGHRQRGGVEEPGCLLHRQRQVTEQRHEPPAASASRPGAIAVSSSTDAALVKSGTVTAPRPAGSVLSLVDLATAIAEMGPDGAAEAAAATVT